MKNSWKFAATALSAAALLGGLHGAAHADLFTFATQASDEALNVGKYTGGVYVGRYTATIDGGTGINVFCVDFNQEINNPDQFNANIVHALTEPADPNSSASLAATGYYNGGLASALTPSDYAPLTTGLSNTQRADETAYLADTYLNQTLTNDQAAAIQLSIWDIVQDGGNGIGSGQVSLSGTQFTTFDPLVNYYEGQAGLYGTGVSKTAVWVQAPRTVDIANTTTIDPGNHKQEFVFMDGSRGPQGSPVPEPGPLAMLASLGAAVGGLLLKRLRTRHTA